MKRSISIVIVGIVFLEFSGSIIHQKEDFSDSIKVTITELDSGYSFYGRFEIEAEPECVLALTFDYQHVREFAMNAEEVELISEGENWNKIRYTYRRFMFFTNTSEWRRDLNVKDNKVSFYMTISKNNRKIMPEMISSFGYYKVKKMNEHLLVEYFQECKISRSIFTNIYINQTKSEAETFMYEFFVYADRVCGLAHSSML